MATTSASLGSVRPQRWSEVALPSKYSKLRPPPSLLLAEGTFPVTSSSPPCSRCFHFIFLDVRALEAALYSKYFSRLTGSCRPLQLTSMSISASQSAALPPEVNNSIEEDGLLNAVNNDHEGVMVEMKDPMDPTAFLISLRKSLTTWKKQEKKVVWIKLPIELANLIEAAVEEGFWYHHAEPDYLMLVRSLDDTKHTVPANASHKVAVGAFIMNDKREILVVQEKNGRLRGTGLWKFPTGVIEQGEDIYAGVMREVQEETGIDTEFIEILAFRESHKSLFEKSDLFFMCLLRPLSHDISPQELEIEAAQWMPVEEYATQPSIQGNELLKHILDVSLARVDNRYTGFLPVQVRSNSSTTDDSLYLNIDNLN